MTVNNADGVHGDFAAALGGGLKDTTVPKGDDAGGQDTTAPENTGGVVAGGGSMGGDGQGDGQEPGKAPWDGEDNPFDPQRAWRLIQNLRNENAMLKAQDASRANNDDGGLLQLRTQLDQVVEQNRVLSEQVTKNAREAALREAGIDTEFVDLVDGSTPEEISQSVRRLVQLRAGREDLPPVLEPGGRGVDGGAEPNRNDLWRQSFGF